MIDEHKDWHAVISKLKLVGEKNKNKNQKKKQDIKDL